MTSGAAFVLFKALIGFGLPLAFCWHQLRLLEKDKKSTPPSGEPQIAPNAGEKAVAANEDEPIPKAA